MPTVKRHSILSAVLLGIVLAGVVLSAQEKVLHTGHYDLGINYTREAGWDPYIWDYGAADPAQTRLNPWYTIYHLGAAARSTVPAGSGYALLGAPGDPVWILPEIFAVDRVYLGIGAPLLERGVFTGGLSNRGQISLRLLAVSGSGPERGGHLAMWQAGAPGKPPRYFFSTGDGIGPEDSLDAITANFHAHYNWGFTQPGLYRVSFEYAGTLTEAWGSAAVSRQITYSFEVEDPVATPLRYAWPQGDGWVWSPWMGSVYAAHAPWYYHPRTGWLFFQPGGPDDAYFWTPSLGWRWTSQAFFPWVLEPLTQTWALLP